MPHLHEYEEQAKTTMQFAETFKDFPPRQKAASFTMHNAPAKNGGCFVEEVDLEDLYSAIG